MNKKTIGILLFLIGLGTSYRVPLFGQIGISEIFVFLLAPLIFLRDIPTLRRDKFMPMVMLTLLTVFGCIVSSMYNKTHTLFVLKGLAAPYSLFAGIVVLHGLLRKDPMSIRWLALGFGIAPIVSLYLHGNTISTEIDAESVTMESINRLYVLTPLLLCPIAGWYLRLPRWYSIGVPFLWGAFCIATTASGRSTAVGVMAIGVLGLMAGKTRKTMTRCSRHFVLLVLSLAFFGAAFKVGYGYLAKKGTLGNVARQKYMTQTRDGSSLLAMLMAGRTAFFAGEYAAIDRPIVGFGPWARDYKGYSEYFMAKYGNAEDYAKYMRDSNRFKAVGLLPSHSHIISFWHSCGIVGLVFWLYVLWLVYVFFKKYIGAVPIFTGYVFVWAPAVVWAIMFSPFSQRMPIASLIVVLLFAINVGRQRMVLPSMGDDYRRYIP